MTRSVDGLWSSETVDLACPVIQTHYMESMESIWFGFWFWRYLKRELIWHFSQFSWGPQFILVWLWNHARIRSWNQPVLSNKGKVYCSRKQRGPLMGLKPMTSTLRVRCATHCATPPLGWNDPRIGTYVYSLYSTYL